VVSVNLSADKGVPKDAVLAAEFRPEFGVVGDAHAGPGLRQVSLLALESIERQRQVLQERRANGEEPRCGKGCDLSRELRPGVFAENLTICGIGLAQLPLGTWLRVGKDVVLEVSKIGKECHVGCAIFELLGDCVMPREGVFARVITGGVVHQGDEVIVDASGHPHDQ
jgi:hypothetical protein